MVFMKEKGRGGGASSNAETRIFKKPVSSCTVDTLSIKIQTVSSICKF
jgi:hypothetical protein